MVTAELVVVVGVAGVEVGEGWGRRAAAGGQLGLPNWFFVIG